MKRKNKLIKYAQTFLVIFTLFGINKVFAQETEKWQRIESEDKLFSVALPPNSIIDAEKREYGQRLRVVGYQNGVQMELKIIHADVKERLRRLNVSDDTKITTSTVGEFTVVKFDAKPLNEKFLNTIWLARKNTLYVLRIAARTGQEKEIPRFMYSINLQDKPLFVQKEKLNLPEETIAASLLKTSPEVTEGFNRTMEKGRGKITYEISSEESIDAWIDGMSRRVVILESPQANFSSVELNKVYQILPAKLKVTFLANGQVGDVVALTATNKEFLKACAEAAQKIRFVPAQVNGKNVDSVEIIDYTVHFYKNPTDLRPR